MRNLKRALSLALASVMLLGMMVVGTSAASYPDVDENDNVEAIEVLNAVKVMIGRQGNFEPDEAVNRHEMAVIMAKLVLGNETADNYVGTHPFTDVVSWADKYVAACYENGLVAGTSATTFSGNQPLTAVQAAAMMLRALGYKDLSKGADDWRAPVTAMANQIRLFSGVASNPSQQLDRNQVAQLALNTLKSPVVDLKDGTFDISSGDGQVIITGGSREYIVRSSYESYARAINRTEIAGTSASQISGYTVELGEHLYNGKLRLEDTTDAFGRPAREWIYDGTSIGEYAKDELLRQEYTAKVTGKDLYDLLGTTVLNNSDWDVYITVDGETEKAVLEKGDISYFTRGNLVRTNTNAIGATDKGVLTQVFVDSGNKDVYIAIINTYLAKATRDYDSKKEEANLRVYGVEDVGSGSTITLVKNTDNKDNGDPYTKALTVLNEDINVENVKEDDFFLVNVADGEIKIMTVPEVKSEATITAFKQGSWVKSGSQIDYADTAKYDPEVLDDYDQTNMKDVTFNIFLDKYGYLIGLEQNEDPDQYVFITGRQAGNNDLGNANADMRAIFLDGTVKVIKVDVKASDITRDGAIANTWCKYTVDKNDVYTLDQIGDTINDGTDGNPKVKVAQSAQNVTGTNELTIDKSHVSLNGGTGYAKVYGNDDTVYLNVGLSVIGNASDMHWIDSPSDGTGSNANSAPYYVANHDGTNTVAKTGTGTTTRAAIIDEVESVTTGVKNVSLKIKNVDKTRADDVSTADKRDAALAMPVNEVYTLYKDNGYVIAAVVIGEDDGVSSNYVYITGNDYNSESYDKDEDEWTWTLEAVINGKLGDLREVGSTIKYLDEMTRGNWYKVKYDANGNVRGYETLTYTNVTVGSADAKNVVGKYIVEVADVENALDEHNPVVMQASYIVDKGYLTYKNGTLYTKKGPSEGFSISRTNLKTVLCLSKLKADGTVTPFDDVDDDFDGYTGLENAIDKLDDNFKGYLNVLFEDGVATVIILDDRTGTSVDEGQDTNDTSKIGDIYADLRDLSAIVVNTTKASLDNADGYDAVIAALKAAGYTLPAAGETGAPTVDADAKLTGNAIKGGITYPYEWDPAGTNTKNVGGVKITYDGKEMIADETASVQSVKYLTGAASTTGFVKITNGSDVSYVANDDTSTALKNNMEIESGWYQVKIGSNAVTDADLNLKSSGIETDGTDTFAKGTSKAVKGSTATGTGLKVGSTYYAYGTAFKDMTATSGVIAITLGQVKLTIVDDTVGSEATTVVPQAYNTTKQDLSAVTGIASTGTKMYVNSRTSTAQALTDTVDVSKDVTVYVGYVDAGTISDTALGHTITRTCEGKTVTAGTILKVGSKLTATVTIASGGTALDAKDTIDFGSSATVKGYPNGTLTTTGGTQAAGDVATGKLTIPTSTTAVTGSISAEYTVGTSQFTQGITIASVS